MQLKGHHLLGNSASSEGAATFLARNPSNGEELPTAFYEAIPAEVDQALQLATEAFQPFRKLSAEDRAAFLEAIADEIETLGDDLLERTGEETALPRPRLEGERGRTLGQIRGFAALLREGNWVDARIDHALPDRAPIPKPDIRSMLQPLGPTIVFGASNFPLAISVAGADTIAALGAGCPVIVKGHPGHPGACEMVGKAILAAAKKCDLPNGVFSLIQGASHEVGTALVTHPLAKVVAFTGSLAGGRALADLCAARPEPIPFYGELGSVNPVFLLPGALAERAEGIAEGFLGSLTLGVGQFCTNPGLVLGLDGDDFQTFSQKTSELIAEAAPATMLHVGIHSGYEKGVERLTSTKGVEVAASGPSGEAGKSEATPVVFATDATSLLAEPSIEEEVFGPAATLVRCSSKTDLLAYASQMQGSLTATIHGTEADLESHADLLAVLEQKVGRLVFNGFPTGIEVCPSMHHGGPYPASTHSHFTSIGSNTILKFTRPICYQGFPEASLPPELQESNPLGLSRLVDGVQG